MSKIVLVTGANRGIGKEVALRLAQHQFRVIAASRTLEKAIETQLEFRNQGLEVDVLALDVSNPSSITSAFEEVQQRYGSIDILINNAGINGSGWSQEVFNEIMQTNFYGPVQAIRLFSQIIPEGGQIINVTSELGKLKYLNDTYKNVVTSSNSIDELLTVPFLPDEQINSYMNVPVYQVAKACLNRATQIFSQAFSHANNHKQIFVNSCCPGWVKTDMGGQAAPRTIEQGGASILALALNTPTTTGGFFRDGEPISFEE